MIKAGLIGGKLSHSLSPQIHHAFWHLCDMRGAYALIETPAEKLGDMLDTLAAEGYTGVNVTIPHKKAVMRYLDTLSPEARSIGAVNTVHFFDGRRIGYNTDYFGLASMLSRHGIVLAGKLVVILGAGGAARCAFSLAKEHGAANSLVLSRSPEKADRTLGAMDYGALDTLPAIDVLINTTPAGMHPDTESCPVPDTVIQKCAAVADLVYNPEQTVLLKKASSYGKTCAGGLWMLCAQALKAQEIWTGRAYDEALCTRIYNTLRKTPERTNIVLTGMPGSGKTTIGLMLAEKLGRKYIDTDELIEAAHGRIQHIFAKQGEAVFRGYELAAARQAAADTHSVIATGGGIVLTEAAMAALRETGVIVHIDRPLELLLKEVDTAHRPLLSGGRQRLVELHAQRQHLYKKYADFTVQNAADAASCADETAKRIKEFQT